MFVSFGDFDAFDFDFGGEAEEGDGGGIYLNAAVVLCFDECGDVVWADVGLGDDACGDDEGDEEEDGGDGGADEPAEFIGSLFR